MAEVLWRLNDYLDSLKRRDDNRYIKDIKQEDYKNIVNQIKKVREEVRGLINSKRKKKAITIKSDSTIANEVKNMPDKDETPLEPEYKSLIDMIMSLGIDISDELKIVFQLIDEQYLQTTKETKEYYTILKKLKQDIEERLDE